MTDLSKCPNCGGEADNGHDRCYPPNPYYCKKCMKEEQRMTDRELLELAAKAAGIEWENVLRDGGIFIQDGAEWNPLTDDGDALRLAVKLGISILPYPVYNQDERHSVIAKQRRHSDCLRVSNPTEVVEIYGADPYSATRRAIVRAAAAIGEMK